ncbi:MAG: dTMP kinase [Methyloligellaceae bacterium]
MANSQFITFEGGEGAGKSTQVALLSRRLEAIGEKVVLTREPGGSERAEKIRHILMDNSLPDSSPLTEALLFYAARADHLKTLILPALEQGAWVLCDRFSDSTRAYQGAAGGLDPTIIENLESMVVGNCKPGMTLILDIPADIGLARAQARQADQTPHTRDRFESKSLTFHKKLREGFLYLATEEPQRFEVIDATKTPEDIESEIWAHVKSRWNLRE